MRTTNFSPILFNAIQFSGNDRQNIADDTFSQFRDFINDRIRSIWELQDWPDLIRLEQLVITDEGNGLITAAIPVNAGEVLTCYDKDPLASTRASELSFKLYDNGSIQKLIIQSDPQQAYCEYRIKRPELVGELYSASIAYSPGAQCYFDSGSGTGSYIPVPGKPHSGNFYTCISNTISGQNPNTNPEKWSIVSIPYYFAAYSAKGAFADWLKSELQLEAGQAAEMDAERTLNDTIDIIARQQKQINRINMIRTY